MSQKDNIEELFRSKLESFESPVNDAMWTNISNGIGANAAASSSTSSIFSSLFSTTGIAITTGIICTAVTVMVMSSNDKNITPVEPEQVIAGVTTPKENKEVKSDILEIINDDEIAVNNIVSNSGTDNNDPSIKKEETEQYIIKPTVNNPKEENYVKPASVVNSFLTPKSQLNEEQLPKENNSITEEQNEPEKEISIIEAEDDVLIATIIASPVGGYAPLDVYFSNPATRGSVLWSFGDGSTSDEFSPSHTFEKYGTYTVELIITDEKGVEQKDYRVIEVLANSAVTDIPNVFTPNGDGINDLFIVKGKNLETFQMKVFNRSGEVIFASESMSQAWNGKDKYGSDIATGTYFYLISARGIDGKLYEHTGTVTLNK